MIRLAAGAARADVAPAMGAGLADLRVADCPVLRPWSGRLDEGPFSLALNLLAPFSNRIAGGFAFAGRRYDLAPNLASEPLPIHGDAFQKPWAATMQAPDHLRLSLADGAFGPLLYTAEAEYRLTPARLTLDLRLTSRADCPLPFGGGFHPWFPRSDDTRLQFRATGCWPEDSRHLPATPAPVPTPADWRWDRSRPLPQGWINAGFSGWDGSAAIGQGPGAVSVRLSAPGLSTALVYSPSGSADFFCFEPVSHPVDAHNLPERPGLVTLATGESLGWQMTLEWETPRPTA